MAPTELPENARELAEAMNQGGTIAVLVIAHPDGSYEVKQHPDLNPGGITITTPAALTAAIEEATHDH